MPSREHLIYEELFTYSRPEVSGKLRRLRLMILHLSQGVFSDLLHFYLRLYHQLKQVFNFIALFSIHIAQVLQTGNFRFPPNLPSEQGFP